VTVCLDLSQPRARLELLSCFVIMAIHMPKAASRFYSSFGL